MLNGVLKNTVSSYVDKIRRLNSAIHAYYIRC